jgi:hypothetical protein
MMLDLKLEYGNSNYWVIGVQDEELYGVELRGMLTEPTSRLPTKVIKMNFPFIKNANFSSEEENIAQLNFFIKHDQWRTNTFKELKNTRTAKLPDFYYTDSLKEDNDINTRKKEHDKNVLQTMKEYIVAGNSEKVIDLFDMLMMNKSRELAITMVTGLDEQDLVQFLNNKLKYLKMLEEKNRSDTNTNTNHYMPVRENQYEQRVIRESTLKENTKEEEKQSLSSLAVNLNNFKDLENEVRHELETKFDEDKNIKIEDLSSLRYNSNLERKNVK